MLTSQKFGELRIIEKIGSGSFGHVYHVKDKQNNNYAVKLMQTTNHGITPEIIREINVLQQLSNYNSIIKLLDIIKNKYNVCLVFEFANCDLCEWTQLYDFKYRINKIKEITTQLAESIFILHQFNIIHRDIKPANVLLMNDKETIKLCDFGLSKKILSVNNTPDICTLRYRSPELLLNSKTDYSFPIDIWSFGCVIYKIITGKEFVSDGCGNEIETLLDIFRKLGTPDSNIINNIGCSSITFENFPKNNIKELIIREIEYDKNNDNLLDTNLLDLLSKMLVINPDERITITEVIEHPYIKHQNIKYQNIKSKIGDISETLLSGNMDIDNNEYDDIINFIHKVGKEFELTKFSVIISVNIFTKYLQNKKIKILKDDKENWKIAIVCVILSMKYNDKCVLETDDLITTLQEYLLKYEKNSEINSEINSEKNSKKNSEKNSEKMAIDIITEINDNIINYEWEILKSNNFVIDTRSIYDYIDKNFFTLRNKNKIMTLNKYLVCNFKGEYLSNIEFYSSGIVNKLNIKRELMSYKYWG